MHITHIIRGQEFLASMPNYLNLYEALDIEVPKLATVPHILNEQGNKKLSKPDGAKDILDYRKEGYLAEAMLNFLASMGWNDGTEQEIFSVDELIKRFSLSHVGRAGAHFDEQRLMWINGAHIRELTVEELYIKVADFWPLEARDFSDKYKKQVLGLVQERLKYFAELPQLTNFFFKDLPIDKSLITKHKQLSKVDKGSLKTLLEHARRSLDESSFRTDDLINRLNALLAITHTKPAVLFSLIRIATTQSPASPGLADTLAVLGKDRSLARIDGCLSTL
jgi:glutamyl/glutaminyl-tRNA synthetase